VADLADAGYADFLPLFGKASDAQAGAEAKVGMMAENTEVATLAGGCFWGMEQIIREIPGVIDT
jgi:peptide methionine sulfoxide reductase msrA/msrB